MYCNHADNASPLSLYPLRAGAECGLLKGRSVGDKCSTLAEREKSTSCGFHRSEKEQSGV